MILNTPQLPLFDFFQSLRDWEKQLNQQTLTLTEYELLSKVLDDCPFPLESKEDYFRLCKLLWFKPLHQDFNVANAQNTEGGTFRKKFDEFWSALENYNNAVPNTDIKTEQKEPPTSAVNPNRALTKEELEKREKEEVERRRLAEENKEKTAFSNNDNELSPYWADFSTTNTEGSPIGTASADGEKGDKNGLAIKQNFTFLEKHQFLPLDYRRLYQLVMSVRRVAFDGGRNDLDVEASFNQLIRQGYLTEFAYQQQARRWLGVHLLIDRQGSMAAFEHIGDVIAEILSGDAMGNAGPISDNKKSHIWYFHNCPNTVLYRNKDLFDGEKLENWLKTLQNQAPAQIIIFSDAGAARGFRSDDRINATVAFLQELTKHRVAWINPVAQSRWLGSSASAIERRVKMFDAHDASFVAAMQAIKGK